MTPIDRVLELLDLEAAECPESWMQEGIDEIARLDREVSVARNLASLAKGIVDEQAARIKELEGWLVEERMWFSAAEDGHYFEDLNELVDLPGETSQATYEREAHEQLRAEGKL